MLHLVCYHPAIPQNAGNMIRTCAATNTQIHFIEPLGFELSDKAFKRASMDYINIAALKVYPSWENFMEVNKPENIYFMSRYADKTPSDFDYSDTSKDYYFVVGHEHDGIDLDILREHLETCIRIPMVPEARSLNVSNAAAMIVYEALRQQNYHSLSFEEVIKGPDYLKK